MATSGIYKATPPNVSYVSPWASYFPFPDLFIHKHLSLSDTIYVLLIFLLHLLRPDCQFLRGRDSGQFCALLSIQCLEWSLAFNRYSVNIYWIHKWEDRYYFHFLIFWLTLPSICCISPSSSLLRTEWPGLQCDPIYQLRYWVRY